MNRIVTYFSVATAAFALAFGFEQKVNFATLLALICVFITFLGYRLEHYIRTNGNDILNKFMYFMTKNENNYNIVNKHSIYTCLDNNSYTFVKKLEIEPRIGDLDRINERFSWSAPSAGCIINPTESTHRINTIWQQESWTCFSIYFNKVCEKRKTYCVGSEITNLIDKTNSAVPFLSNTIDRKTKCITLEVVFPKDSHPDKAKFEIFSSNCGINSNYEEEISYDRDIGGFKKVVHYPRKGWRYVISWN